MRRAKWEYLHVKQYTGTNEIPWINGHAQDEMGSSIWETLNRLGQEGWEVVGFTSIKTEFQVILKRMI